MSKKAPHQVFAVHSGIVGEGKSFISANLATLFALNGKKVLLVEGDLRRPVMHKIFSDDARQGLSDYLNGSILLQDVKRNTNIKNLDIVFAGSETKNPAELLNSDLLEDFITKTRAEYDYVIVDNAPLDIVNDAMQFIPLADINLFLLRVNFSTYKQLNFINKLTHQGMIKNMVLVVNNAPFDKQLANKYSIKYFNEKQN